MSLADDAASDFVGVEVDTELGLDYLKPDMLGYLAAPYSAKDKAVTRRRIAIFAKCDAALMARGIKTASPLLKDMILQHANLPGDWAYWGEYSEMMLGRLDVVIVLMIDGWKESEGVRAEIDLAIERGIPVVFVNPAELIDMNQVNDDGAILVKVSKIENTFGRRLAIAGSFIPMLAGTTLLVGIGALKGLLRNIGVVFKSARKHW